MGTSGTSSESKTGGTVDVLFQVQSKTEVAWPMLLRGCSKNLVVYQHKLKVEFFKWIHVRTIYYIVSAITMIGRV